MRRQIKLGFPLTVHLMAARRWRLQMAADFTRQLILARRGRSEQAACLTAELIIGFPSHLLPAEIIWLWPFTAEAFTRQAMRVQIGQRAVRALRIGFRLLRHPMAATLRQQFPAGGFLCPRIRV